VKTVRLHRDRFLAEGLPGLDDRPRSGRPPVISLEVRYETIKTACAKPSEFGVQYRDIWTIEELARVVLDRHPELGTFSPSTAWRIISRADVKPHQEEMWLHSPDPEFKAKVAAICEIYLKVPPGSIILCIDEKTGMQALGRFYDVKPATEHRPGRRDADYIRHGTRSMIAAFNPHSGRVFAHIGATRKADDLMAFMEDLAREYPGVDIYVVWDNLNIHHGGRSDRWTEFNKRHGDRFHFLYTPLHASWVNQVESWFAIVQRRILRHGVFESVEDLGARIRGFIDYWNSMACRPFRWKFKGYPLDCSERAAA